MSEINISNDMSDLSDIFGNMCAVTERPDNNLSDLQLQNIKNEKEQKNILRWIKEVKRDTDELTAEQIERVDILENAIKHAWEQFNGLYKKHAGDVNMWIADPKTNKTMADNYIEYMIADFYENHPDWIKENGDGSNLENDYTHKWDESDLLIDWAFVLPKHFLTCGIDPMHPILAYAGDFWFEDEVSKKNIYKWAKTTEENDLDGKIAEMYDNKFNKLPFNKIHKKYQQYWSEDEEEDVVDNDVETELEPVVEKDVETEVEIVVETELEIVVENVEPVIETVIETLIELVVNAAIDKENEIETVENNPLSEISLHADAKPDETDVIALVTTISENYTRIIHRDELRKYKKLDWGDNGIGDRWCGKKFNYSVIFANRHKTYSENDDDVIPTDALEQFYQNNVTGKAGIIGIFVHSKRTYIIKRPIRKEIDREIKKMPCVCCGSKSDLICDHKNDIYNDESVLDVNTQCIDDFQSLCNHCNLQKRQIFREETVNNQIYSAKNLAPYRMYPFEFPWEKKTFDVKDVNTKNDTFWYDPVEFNKKIFLYMNCTIPILNELKNKIKKQTLVTLH